MVAKIEAEVDDLYAADLDDFVKLRNDLAKRLRADDGQAADSVKSMRKPSLVAWTANQAVREAPREARKLLEAGERLVSAQKDVIKGGRAAALDETRRAHEEAVARLVAVGAGVLEQRGRPGTRTTLDRLAGTLRAASVQEDFRERLERGRLEEEVEPAGFDALAAMGGGAPAPQRRGRSPRQSSRASLDSLRAALKRSRERERTLEAEARGAAREAERARRQAATLEQKAAAATRKADEATEARVEAEKQLTDAGGRRSG